MGLEGGVGGDFLKGGLTLGLSYYAAFKLSDDEIDGLPGVLIRGKNRVFAVGPEATAGDRPQEYGLRLRARGVYVRDLCANDDAGRSVVHQRHVPDQAAQDTDALTIRHQDVTTRLTVRQNDCHFGGGGRRR